MAALTTHAALLGLLLLLLHARPTLAFGAGNVAGVSKVEGINWRHGDIEDTLLTILLARAVGGKNFDKLTVSRVYFGNWLRDYSQAIDVGTVKAVSSEAIRLLLCVLGFMTFGYGSKEFEVTADRLGCYRPEDHIDNPKNYADNVDARKYDRRLRGPVDERVELAIDPDTGMKNYIANEGVRIMTSAEHVRNLFGKCIELGRNYARSKNAADLHEALRLLGTGLHCLEDFLAHSNYVELALIELGEKDIFPHVGSRTRMRLQGARGDVYPLVTGTFGGVDFLHSVTGEVSDKLTQNEIEELEGTLQNIARNDNSAIENLLDSIPDGLFDKGGKKKKMQEIQGDAANSQMEDMNISPRDPKELTLYVQQVFARIMPAIEFHDDLMKSISEAIGRMPVLPKILEQLEERTSIWVFSIMAPFIVPVIQQVKNELRIGSNQIIESSKNEQHIVFEDDHCTDPTHSMLSKDHFSNVLNEIAGKTASKVVAWVVPQLMDAWDDRNVNVDQLMDRIIQGVLHHPAQRDQGDRDVREGRKIMFRSVEEWWGEMDQRCKNDRRRQLSRRGVENGENHKDGIQDCGHGCGKPLGMQKNFAKGGSLEDRIAGAAADAIMDTVTGKISSIIKAQTGVDLPDAKRGGRKYADDVSEAESGGLGGLIGAAGSLLGYEGKSSSSSKRYDKDSYTESHTEYGSSGDRYAKAEYSRTKYSDGGESESYRRQEQGKDRRGNTSSYTYEERTETVQSYGSSDRERTQRYENTQQGSYGNRRQEGHEGRQEGSGYGGRQSDDAYGSGRSDTYGSRRDNDSGRRENESYGGRRDNDSSRRDNEGYGRHQESDNTYGGRRSDGHSSRRNDSDEQGSNRNQAYGRTQGSSTTGSQGGHSGNDYSENRNKGYGSQRDDGDASGSRGNYGAGRDHDEYNRGGSEYSSGYGGGGSGGRANQGRRQGRRDDDGDDDDDNDNSGRRGGRY